MKELLELILELTNIVLEQDIGLRNRMWLEELISELYEQLAADEAEQGFAELIRFHPIQGHLPILMLP